MQREKPTDPNEVLNHLWYTVIGTNGEGLFETVKRVEDKLDEYFLGGGKEKTCYFLRNKEEVDGVLRRRKRTLGSMSKYLLSEGVKIGTAMGVFAAIGKMVGWL